MSRGKFIVITGGDGAGKTTCARQLLAKCEAKKMPVVFTKEPGGTMIGQQVRQLLLADTSKAMDKLTELLLFAADRAQHISEKVKPSLERGQHVISDRSVESSFAYQVRANQRPDLEAIFNTANNKAMAGAEPDLYIVLDLPETEGLKRVGERSNHDRFEAEALDYHARVRQGIMDYVADKPHKIVDASQSIEQVADQVFKIVVDLCK